MNTPPIRRMHIFFPQQHSITNPTPNRKSRKIASTPRRKTREREKSLFSDNFHCIAPPRVPKTASGRRNYRITQPKFLVAPPEPKFVERFSSLKRSVENAQFIDNICPICKDKLGAENVCILSCGHLVHRTCLNAFNILMQEKSPRCPVCHELYRVIEIQIDMRTLNRNAIIIQRHARGFLVRLHILDYAPKGSLMHKKWIVKQTQRATHKISDAIERQNDCVDMMLCAMDEQLEWARNVMRAVEVKEKHVDWEEIRRIARKRMGRCVICLKEIDDKKAVVTSCGHIFHEDCLESWMKYCSKEHKQSYCPECRSFFQVRPLTEKRLLNMDVF